MSAPEPNEQTILEEVLRLEPGEARVTYLQGACGGDGALQARLEWLIGAHEAAGGFLPDIAAGAGFISRLEDGCSVKKVGEVIGRHKLLQKIGEGGCGVVYLAEQEEPVRRQVALKLIKVGMDTRQVIARFEAERQALAMMDHPNIAKVFDGGATDTGRPYFVMEFVDGKPITTYCDEQELTTRERLELFIPICQAIQHAHQKGIIHRDIKPSNILITLQDGVPVPKVIDFGIAKATQQEFTEKTFFTQFSQLVGTPVYMSPEQAEMSPGGSRDIDTRADIYSLGVLLYEMLVGRTPFDVQDLLKGGYDEIRRRITAENPPKPSTKIISLKGDELKAIARRRKIDPTRLSSALRGDLDWIVMKALEKDRMRRYETANGFARDVKRYLADEPVEAAAPSGWYLLGKFVKRHRTMLGVAAGFAALLVIATSISAWQAIRATQASQSEKVQRLAAQAERDKAHKAQQLADAERAKAEHALYVAGMNLAQVAWEQNNIGRVREILWETESYSDRGFEWFYWQRQTHLESSTLRWGTIWGASAFSPDAERVVTAISDATIAKVWDLASGKEVFNLPRHRAGVIAMAYSRDGKRIVTACDDHRTAFVWDAVTGNILATLHTRYGACRNLAISSDNQRLVAGFWNNTAKVWDALSGKQLLVLQGHTKHVTSVAFSPDSRRIVTGSEDTTAKVWNAATGTELFALNQSATVNSLAYSDDGRWILSGGDNATKVWDARNGQPVLTLKGQSQAVAFSPDAQRIVTGGGDRIIRVWNATSGQELFSFKGHNDSITTVAFSPDGQRILTAGTDATAKIWDITKQAVIFRGHQQPIAGVAFSPDGRRIATASNEETDPWNRLPTRGAVKVWDASNGSELLTLTGHTSGVNSVAFSSDGTRLATASNDGTAKVWDALTGRNLQTLDGHIDKVYSAAFSPDGQRIATSSKDGTIIVWDATDGRRLLSFSGGRLVMWVSFSPDGQRLLTPNVDGRAVVWEAATGKEVLSLGNPQFQIFSAAFSRDGGRIVTGGFDRVVRVWDAKSGQDLVDFRGHGEPVWTAIFSPDGRRILTGSGDGTAKLWKADSGKELLTLQGHTAGIRSVAFSPDGQRIVTTSYDATARIWEVATPQLVAAWKTEEKANEARVEGVLREEAAEVQRVKELEAQARAQRARDPGAIKQWWVLAPIPLDEPTHAAAIKALDSEQIGHESSLRPDPSQTVTVGRTELAWKRVELQDYLLDVDLSIGKHTEWCMGYAIAYIQSEQAQSALRMKVGSGDFAKVYLNGREIYRNDLSRDWAPDDEVVEEIDFRPGLNVLVIKLVHEMNEWLGSIAFTGNSGQPLTGIRVSLQPP